MMLKRRFCWSKPPRPGTSQGPAHLGLAKRIVDHALDYGWDTQHGGFSDAGGVFGPVSHWEKVVGAGRRLKRTSFD